jgi:hypothetical protein
MDWAATGLIDDMHDLAEPDRLVARDVLSTDYLNHFAEALMLIEAVTLDDSIASELAKWRPISYRQHFTTSELRCAPHALKAYDALDHTSRGAFEALCSAMNRLVETVLLTLSDVRDPAQMVALVEIAARAFHSLLTRATRFINSGGDMRQAAYDTVELQDAIDQLMDM